MTEAVVAELMLRPKLAAIDSEKFPKHTPLEEIIRNDARIVDCQVGDIVVREGDYGNSAFVVLDGTLRVVLSPELPRNMLGRLPNRTKGLFETLAQLWRNDRRPEIRDVARYRNEALRDSADKTNANIFLQDVPTVLDNHRTETFTGGMMFGELGALGRLPRTLTIFAETDARIFEIRWQALRDGYSDPRANDGEPGAWYHHAGRVDLHLLKDRLPSNNYDFYVCGPPPMKSAIFDNLRG